MKTGAIEERMEIVAMDELTAMMNRIRKEHSRSDCREEHECTKCNDIGFVVSVDENGREFACRCDCYEMQRTRELLQQSGISEEFCGKSFDNFDTGNIQQLDNAKSKARQYVTDFMRFEHEKRNSILFSGQVGAGKTHLGMAVCNELLTRHMVGVVYMSYRNVITEIKQTVMDKENYYAAIGRFCNARLLYIDDLLKGRSTEADLNILYELVNYRYMHNKPMVISTEKTPEALIGFDEAVGSRILEMCRGKIVILRGQELNYRLYS